MKNIPKNGKGRNQETLSPRANLLLIRPNTKKSIEELVRNT